MLMKVHVGNASGSATQIGLPLDGNLLDQLKRERSSHLVFSQSSALAAQRVDPEQRLYAGGACGSFVYVIVSGIMRFERVTEAGRRRITRLAGPGDLIGQEAILKLAYRDDALACTPVSVHKLSASLARGEDQPDRSLFIALLSRLQATLDESEFWSTEVTTGPVRRRVLQLLAHLDRHRDAAEFVWLPRRDQMGDMLDTTVETCSRVISGLRREGVLELVPPSHARLDLGRVADALRRSNH